MNKVVIIGGKGTAVVIAEQIYDAQKRFNMDIEMLGFAFDDDSFGGSINDFPILCKTTEAYSKYEKYSDVGFIYSLYRSDIIKERTELLHSYNIPVNRFINFVHPSVYIAKSATMGYGNVILANTVINPNVEMGNYNTFNSNSLIGHDTKMGDNNFFAGHACVGSNIKMGNQNFFGLNASVKNFITLGHNNIIGMSANLTKSLDEGITVVGNPAKPVGQKK